MKKEIIEFLNAKAIQYENPNFIESDPISIAHRFDKKEDIEISAFLTATISWGQRKTILKNANSMMQLMDSSPFEFVINSKASDLKKLEVFVHRTFNGNDLTYFILSLQNIYKNHNSLEDLFYSSSDNLRDGIQNFRTAFLSMPHEHRLEKHISSPLKNSACKRLNMFLRWMIRSNAKGVDFGIWSKIEASQLSCPLDVHSARVARKLGLLNRKQNDWKAVEELDLNLRQLDSKDPIKYDFALFGLGVFEKF